MGGGALVPRVEILLTGLLGGDRRLKRGELALGLRRPGPRRLDRLSHPADLAGQLLMGRLGIEGTMPSGIGR